MYQYDQLDQAFVDQRVAEFRDQTRRFLAGELSEDEFKAVRLRNGLYIQRHAPMLRIAIPYGLLSTRQLRKLGEIAHRYDRGYGHFTTRTNLQLNWPKLETVPDILAELATVQMPRQGAHQIHDPPAHQRLTTRQAKPPYAAAHEHTADPIQLFQGQQLRLGQKLHLLTHAVGTAQIAAICH